MRRNRAPHAGSDEAPRICYEAQVDAFPDRHADEEFESGVAIKDGRSLFLDRCAGAEKFVRRRTTIILSK